MKTSFSPSVSRVVFFRYAHIEGKKLRKNDKYQLHHLLIMLCYILFSVAVAFPVNNLRKGSPTQIHRSDLEPVSIFMLKRDRAPERQFELDITDILQEQGWTERNYTLVHSALAIHKVHYDYLCLILLLFLILSFQGPRNETNCIRRQSL